MNSWLNMVLKSSKRKQFIKKLQKWAETIHQGITGGGEVLRLAYLPSFSEAAEEDEAVLMDQFMIKLSQMKEQEIRRGTTLSGPHRDDLSFSLTTGKYKRMVRRAAAHNGVVP